MTQIARITLIRDRSFRVSAFGDQDICAETSSAHGFLGLDGTSIELRLKSAFCQCAGVTGEIALFNRGYPNRPVKHMQAGRALFSLHTFHLAVGRGFPDEKMSPVT